jgi:hypothetical protein
MKVYEVWKAFIEENHEEINEAYIVISANFLAEEYKRGNWSDVEYRGCYTTLQEAVNEIDGYLR